MRSIALAFTTLLLSLLLVSQTANAALAAPKLSYVLKSAKLALSTVDGASHLSKEFSTAADYSKNASPFDLSSPSQLENDDVIRLSFTLGVENPSGKKVASQDGATFGKEHVPHQAFVVLASSQDEGASHAWPIAVKPSTGKASWNLVRLPRILPHLNFPSTPILTCPCALACIFNSEWIASHPRSFEHLRR